MALVNANYVILYMNVGCNGRVTDGVVDQCSLSTDLEINALNMPPPRALPGRKKPVPYVIVSYDAFAMTKHMIKPYPLRGQPGPNSVQLPVITRKENGGELFGILANKFRVLRKPILQAPETTVKVVSAVYALHNFLLKRKESATHCMPLGEVDQSTDDQWTNGPMDEDQSTREMRPGT